MKKLLLIAAASLPFIATSCSSEDMIENVNEIASGKTIMINATINNGTDTKLAYTDNADSKTMTVAWSVNESFIMYRGTNSSGSTFSNSPEGKGKFIGNDIDGEGNYYAVYGDNITNTDGTLAISLSGNQMGTNSENSIKEFMLSTTTNLSSSTTLTFNHMLTVLKLTLTLPDGVSGKVSKLTISGLHNKATYKLADGSYEYSVVGDVVANNGNKGFAIVSNKITAYVSVFPEKVVANQVTILAKVDENEYFYTINSSRELEAGKVVPVNATWAKILTSESGSLTKEALKAAIDANNNNLVIKSDIDLTNSDFDVLREVLADYPAGSINLTLLNQNKFPVLEMPGFPGALLNCTALRSVTAPNLTVTGQDCFMGCSSLSWVSLPKVDNVRTQTFSGCTSITSIYLPQATRLGEAAFSGCTSLTQLYVPQVTDIDKSEYGNAFTGSSRGSIAITVKDGVSWWNQLGDSNYNKFGWKDVYVLRSSNLKPEYTLADYYQWDAIISQQFRYSNFQYNKDVLTASRSCKNSPTKQQVMMYLGAGVYWDNGDDGANQQTYKIESDYHQGMWIMKKEYIRGWNDGTAKAVAEVSSSKNSDCWHIGRPAAGEIHKYFFLPCLGINRQEYWNYNSFDVGTIGYYWSSSFDYYYDYYGGIDEDDYYDDYYYSEHAYYLNFTDTYAKVDYCMCSSAFPPMVAE